MITATVVPETWTPTRLGWLFSPVSDRGHEDVMVLSVYRDHGVIPKNSRTDNFNRTPENLRIYQLVCPGDLVVNRMKAWQGSLGISEYRGIVSPDYEVLRPTGIECDSRFLYSLLRSRALIDQYALRSTGIRPSQWRLYWDEMKTIEVLLPPAAEQLAIADYLDRETARIDTLVEEQQRLIEMLRERRRAMTLHAIGEQTATGAAIDKLGRSARIGNGSTPRRETAEYWSDEGFPWLNSSVVNEPRVAHADQFVTAVALRECHLPVVGPGSILVGLTGQGKTRGMATILDFEATVNQHIGYVTPDRSRWIPEYLLWSLRASYGELRRLSGENGSTKGGLTCEALKQFRLVAPSLDEQCRVTSYLNERAAKIDTLIAETEQFIELSKERRAALITASVTGQIDVRAVA